MRHRAFWRALLGGTCLLCGGATPRHAATLAGGSTPISAPCLCRHCEQSLHPNRPCCPVCAEPSASAVAECRRCRQTPPAYRQAIAPWRYTETAHLLLMWLKKHRSPMHAEALAQITWPALAQALADVPQATRYFIPVPASALSLQERGYNHAERIAQHLVPLARQYAAAPPWRLVDALRLQHAEQAGMTQKKRGGRARRQLGAVHTPFALTGAGRRLIRLAHADSLFLIIDDLMTTGATANAAASALRSAGVATQQILCVAAARTPLAA